MTWLNENANVGEAERRGASIPFLRALRNPKWVPLVSLCALERRRKGAKILVWRVLSFKHYNQIHYGVILYGVAESNGQDFFCTCYCTTVPCRLTRPPLKKR